MAAKNSETVIENKIIAAQDARHIAVRRLLFSMVATITVCPIQIAAEIDSSLIFYTFVASNILSIYLWAKYRETDIRVEILKELEQKK